MAVNLIGFIGAWIDPGALYHWPLAAILGAIGLAWVAAERWRPEQRFWAFPVVTLLSLLAVYWIIPTNVGVPKYPFGPALKDPAPLDPARLYLSVYPPPEEAYRVGAAEGETGLVVRPGSTPFWAGLRFLNGYSPILAGGVAADLSASIHGEIDPSTAEWILRWHGGPESGPALLGVDGIIVADAYKMAPLPLEEWRLVYFSREGKVYHRRGAPLGAVRSLTEIETRPGENFAPVSVTRVEAGRQSVGVDLSVPAGDRPGLLIFSRPNFKGYRAYLNGRRLALGSYRGLAPVLEVPAGSAGRLELVYRPWWLVAGSAAAFACLSVMLVAAAAAVRERMAGAPKALS